MMRTVLVSLSLNKHCEFCNKAYTPKPSNVQSLSRYCSSNCIKRAWSSRNKEKDRQCKMEWVKNNPEKRAKASDDYRRRNNAYYTAYSSLRTRKQLQAKPKCLTELDELVLIEFYDKATRLGLEVDHIIPITHERVCGLHVPENLQMLTRTQNAMKSNKFDEDCLGVING